jgi:hypothetical protein
MRTTSGLKRARSYGIAECLSAGPELLRSWQDARASSQGLHARGAALVAAAIDIRRAGWTSPLSRDLLDHASGHYLTWPEHAHIPSEPSEQAWESATQRREATTALLRPEPHKPDLVEVFDYLVDAVQRERSIWPTSRAWNCWWLAGCASYRLLRRTSRYAGR